MFVANRMAKNPVTVTPDVSLDEAATLMKKGHFRRLPVVDAGKLVGFFSDRDLMRVAPSPATTLSRYEERSLLDKMTVRDVMVKNVITVDEDATLEEAALIMYNHKIGGLPVLSSVGAVVGVITETDIFKAFVDVMGLQEGKERLTVHTNNKVGVVADIADIFREQGVSMDSFVTSPNGDGTYDLIIRGDIPDVEGMKAKIEAAGYEVVHTAKIG